MEGLYQNVSTQENVFDMISLIKFFFFLHDFTDISSREMTVFGSTVRPEKYVHRSCIVVFLCCLLRGNFTHIPQGYFTGTGAITITRVPVKQTWDVGKKVTLIQY